MSTVGTSVSRLPHALRDGESLADRMANTRLAVVLNHDIWSPDGGTLEREEGKSFEDLLNRVSETVRRRRGIGMLVADPDDPQTARRESAADYYLSDTPEVESFLDALGG